MFHHPPFQIQYTQDGSPTLVVANCEPMHSSVGAASETTYIYQECIDFALAAGANPQITSVGLGLGYNEILTFVRATVRGVPPVTLFVFESETWLVEFFCRWLQQDALAESQSPCLPPAATAADTSPSAGELSAIYDWILHHFCREHGVEPATVFRTMQYARKNRRLQFLGSLGPNNLAPVRPAHGILFDAYSRKTSPDLWSENFLEEFLRCGAHDHCCLTTYAATGALKRALRAEGFEVFDKSGFGSKRESTMASRTLTSP